MGFIDEIENFGSQFLGNIENTVQSGGISGLESDASVSGVEGLIENAIPGFGQSAATDQSSQSTDDSGN